MKRPRIGSALVCMTLCAVACALLWPHAHDAGAILAAQDDPAQLSDIQLDSALRSNQAMVAGVAPLRAGLTLVKDARKVGRLGEGLTQWAGRSARQIVDAPMLQNAVASGSVLRPGQTVTAIKAAFRAEKAGALVRLAKDVGRVSEKAGMRGALDTLRIAEGPKDVARP